MKRIGLALFSVGLVSCATPHISNGEIIVETKRCLDAGLKPVSVKTVDGIMLWIQCEPK